MGWFDRFGISRFDEKELALVHSVSKQLIEEIVHVQRGYLPDEIEHVRRELDTLIDVTHRLKSGASFTKRASRKLGIDDHHEHLRSIARALEHESVQKIREPLAQLRSFTTHLHDELHVSITRLPGSEDAPYRPPHHI
jgi:hypothetical protein